jgi:CBS domain-containing protein
VIFWTFRSDTIYLVLQSRTIERRRRQAEAGLVEAKERYRALVEVSNEGSLLIVDGEVVFANPAFMRMSGYTDDELRSPAIWTRLFPDLRNHHGSSAESSPAFRTDSRINTNLLRHLENVRSSQPDQDEFEARITCSGGTRLDVIIRVSRIFLPEQNGHVIAFRPLYRTPRTGFAAALDSLEPLASEVGPGMPVNPETLRQRAATAETDTQIVRLLHQLPHLVRHLLIAEQSAPAVRSSVSTIYATAQRRLLDLAVEQVGPPPGRFALISLGSSGRSEMTLFSDQDNALVFESAADGDGTDRDSAGGEQNRQDGPQDGEGLRKRREKERRYYLNVADLVCSRLDQAGFSYCPGGIMAVNPAYCLSVEEWRETYRQWMAKADPQALLGTHVFFDVSTAGGDAGLVEALQGSVFDLIARYPRFLTLLAQNSLQYTLPLGMLGTVRTEERDGQAVINVKECLIPIINAVRVYALRERVAQSSTIARIHALESAGVLEPVNAQAAETAFETLWKLRFTNQILAHGELRKVNDDLAVADLSETDRRRLQKALQTASALLTRLSYDFLGMDLR